MRITRTKRTLGTLGLVAAATLAGGCATDGGDYEELPVDCGGKCDGFDSIKSLIRDAKDLDLDDLVRIGSPYATDGINDLLGSSDYAQLAIGQVEVYDQSELSGIVTGLAQKFGEKELSTEINALRRDYLQSSADKVFAESAFRFGSDWKLSTGFFDGQANVGFRSGANIEARVIAAFPSETNALLTGPLRAIKESGRGFILPRSLNDLEAMKPGESFGMRAEGTLGINVGVGVPILIAQPFAAVSYSFVVSAGLSARLDGNLDIQVVRAGGSEIVLDVGIDTARVNSARLALDDAWGVQGLLESRVSVAGVDVDLGKLVDKALQKSLNRQLDLIKARYERTSIRMRQSVARFRFDLSLAPRDLVAPAIAQAMRGDVRLAQALANRREPGVRADFDMSRSGASTTSFAGVDIFGMSFFRNVIESEGSVVVQTPGGARTILFDSLHKDSGLFLSRHGYTRVGLAGLLYDGAAAPEGEANLFVQLTEGDKAMERDKLVDHLDGVILGIAGHTAFAALEESANELERFVETTCAGSQAFSDCPIDIITNANAVSLRNQAQSRFDSATASLDPSVRDLVREAARLRLLAQSVYEQKASFTGPGVSMVVDFRVDDGGMNQLMENGAGQRFASAVKLYLKATNIKRIDSPSQIAAARTQIEAQTAAKLTELAAIFDAKAKDYRALNNIESAAIQSLGSIGANMIEVRFAVDSSNRPLYEEATAQSVARARSNLARGAFDALYAKANDLGKHAEQVVGYGILGMLDANRTDLRLDLDMDTNDTFSFWREPYRVAGYPKTTDRYARGSAVSLIGGGMFDVDALIKVE